VGPPGTGKSTVLCKWLAQTVLVDQQAARVWRLDGRAPNTAELVTIYGEILNVPVERSWNGRGAPPVTGFVDVPGTDFQDSGALAGLARLLTGLPGITVHLVLNGAYSIPLLLAQARAFSSLPVSDVIITHLDEEPAWGRLWNLVLGTNYPLRFLSAGQNIPGRCLPARPELLCPALFEGN
jgi:flagellar biosynthesis protein FlhF